MKNSTLATLVIAAAFSTPAFAVDGTTLINQASVLSAGGFPYRITQSGSYRLSGNLIVTYTSGIPQAVVINADNVTLDLNGFSISCSGCAQANSSYGVTTGSLNTAILNGTISGFAGTVAGSAINFGAGVTTYSSGRVDHVIVSGNSWGVQLNTKGTVTITNSTITDNVTYGVVATVGPVMVSNCAITGNPVGINAQGISASILNNLIVGSTNYGIILGAVGGPGAYGLNNFQANGVNASGGVSMGNNVCGSGTC
jgi:hypothetical protein